MENYITGDLLIQNSRFEGPLSFTVEGVHVLPDDNWGNRLRLLWRVIRNRPLVAAKGIMVVGCNFQVAEDQNGINIDYTPAPGFGPGLPAPATGAEVTP